MLRWCLEQDAVAIPKSAHPDRVRENFEVLDFALDEDDRGELARLDIGLRTCWDPTGTP